MFIYINFESHYFQGENILIQLKKTGNLCE